MSGAVAAARRHPRHLVLFAFTAGLLLGPVEPAAGLVAAAIAAWLSGRLPLAAIAAVAVLAGATLSQARVAAMSGGELPAVIGRSIDTRAILLEPIRVRRNGTVVARVRLVGRAELRAARPAPGSDDGSSSGADAGGDDGSSGGADAGGVHGSSSGAVSGGDDGSSRGAVSGGDDGSSSGAVSGGDDGSSSGADAGGATRVIATDDLAGEQAVARAADGRLPPGVRVGSELRLRGSVAALGDYDAYQRRRGPAAAIEVTSWQPTGGARGGVLGALDAARERAVRGLGTGLAPPQAALLRGMVLGQDEAIAPDVRDDFQRSGLAHLLAVSGQNVLLLCTLALAICAAIGVPLRARLIASAAVVALYVPLAGGGPSIQRAGVMGIAGLVAALAGRPASRWYALGLAAAVTLMLNPLAAGDPGWQLSFAAVVGLLALAPPLRERLIRRRVPELVADIAAITIAATLATAPLTALHFEQVSLASLPANLLAAPVVAPVMWLGMLGIALAQVAPPLAGPLAVLCAPLLGYLEWVAHGAADAPLAALPVRLGGPLPLALAYVLPAAAVIAATRLRRVARGPSAALRGVTWRAPSAGAGATSVEGAPASASPRRAAAISRPPGLARVRVVTALAVGALVLGAAIIGVRAVQTRPPKLAPGELVVSFLDVGQGDAILLQRDGMSVLVDTGPPGGPILRRLADSGVDRLDLLVLTHAEADHEGMALPVIAAHRPRMVLDGGAGWPTAVQRGLSDALARTGGRAVAARAGQVVRLGPLELNVLWPPAPTSGWRPDGNPNDRAVVTHVRDGTFDLLLPADAETNVTAALDLPPVEALKVAHHGSADEGLPALLERTSPRIAAIEVGRNSYGHPAPSTLGALRVVPELVRTDRDGTVRLHVRDGVMRLDS